MRAFFGVLLAGLLPVAALADQVVIRIEAKRSATEAQAAAQGWGQQFDDVVTFDLPGGWTAIALGPMERADANARLAGLKSGRAVPGDAFVTPAPDGLAVAAPAQPAVPPPPHGIALATFADRAGAEAALAQWQGVIASAGLWALADGRFAVATAPVDQTSADAWLRAFRAADLVPETAVIVPLPEMGQPEIAAQADPLPAAPAAAAPMPPLAEVQQALAWAGHYDGAIDGRDGPQTQAAITAEVALLQLSPDPGTAMAALIARRAAWRDQMGLGRLDDAATGLSVVAPMNRLAFDRTEGALSIYGPRDGSGAALILFAQEGGAETLNDLAGLVTALGWVPNATRETGRGTVALHGRNDTHIGQGAGRVVNGRAEGWVLIWPVGDADNQPRIAAELADSLRRSPAAP